MLDGVDVVVVVDVVVEVVVEVVLVLVLTGPPDRTKLPLG